MQSVHVEGTIREVLPNALYRIALDDGQVILGHVAGDVRHRWMRVQPGNRVEVILSPYDPTRCRIVKRLTS